MTDFVLADFAARLAPLLGFDVEHEPNPDMRTPEMAWLRRKADGVRLVLDTRMTRGRVEVRAAPPTHTPSGEYVGCDDKRPQITVSPTRELSAIVRDIERRLLPEAAEAHKRGLSRVDQCIARHYAERAACARLGIAVRDKRYTGSRFFGEDVSGDVQVREGGSVYIELRAISVELAEKIIALVEAHNTSTKVA